MTTFDAPNRESFCVQRERSNTPLQALNLMNDVQHFEAARQFAQRVLTAGGASKDARISFAFRTVTSRFPNAQEADIILRTLDRHLAAYSGRPEAAQQAISYGDSKPDVKFNPAELAAWTLVANLLLNMDEVVTKG